MNKKFKIDRLSDDENTSAIISIEYKSDISVQEALDLITLAITKWIKNTEEGKGAWEYSCEDFNIGDLASYIQDENLIKYFKEVGLENVSMDGDEYENSKYIWNFDTVLATASELEEI